jgi:hypothetical protein
VSHSTFGDRYFATRGRLTEVMRGIVRLAHDTGTEPNRYPAIPDLANGLGEPFLIAVCGEIKAGKSTLINGLFGHPLCPTSSLPETDRLLWYRYGNPARTVAITPILEEHYRPLPFLRDFSIIDTPGTNARVAGHLEMTARLLPAAELILCVFPVANPWGASTWNFLSALAPETLQRVVLVVQQADQRDATDLRIILGHIQDLAMQRLGFVPPIFAVSGKSACEAKLATPPNAALLRASGHSDLENFISRQILDSPTRRQSLEDWRRLASIALRAVEDRIEDLNRALNAQGHFLDSIEREIDSIRERFVLRLPTHLASVAEVFETEALWAHKLLRRRLGVFRSVFRLFTRDRTGPTLEAAFIARLQTAVEAVAEQDGVEVVDVCRSHWADLRTRIHAAMAVDLKSSETLDDTLAKAKSQFVLRLGHAAREGIGNLKVRNQLDKDLRRRNRSLKSFTFMTLLLTTSGAVCGALAIALAPAILCGLAGLFFLGGATSAWITRRTITEEFRARLHATCGSFASTLQTDYEDALRLVFEDYTASLATVRTHLAHERLAIEPRLRRWQDLFLTLKAIEQDL